MNLIVVLSIAVGLAMDAFAVSVSCGCASVKMRWSRSLIMAFAFGLFQFLMPLAGWLAGHAVRAWAESFSHYISFGLLVFVGSKMIYESVTAEEGCRDEEDYFKPATLLLLAVATSLDALAAGFAYSDLETGIFLPAAVTGIITFILSAAGTHAGSRVGNAAGRHAETAGGIILLVIAAVILLRELI